jgi:hypothetical protein
VAALIDRFACGKLHQQHHIARVAQPESVGNAQFLGLPLFSTALAVDLALGIGAQLGVHTLNLGFANQPPTPSAKQQQDQARQQRREQGKPKAKGMDHASLRKR